MEFREGATVLGSDGEEVGKVSRIVLDPHTREVTHLIVREGTLFAEEKVISMDLVGPANPDFVTLWEEAGDLRDQPDFEESNYVPANGEAQRAEDATASTRSLFPYPPFVLPQSGSERRLDETETYVEREHRNIPEGTVALQAGASVIASDGEGVGHVDQIFVDSQSEHVTHFLISDGLLRKTTKLIPVSWLDRVRDDEVLLAVESSVIERLPEYEDQD